MQRVSTIRTRATTAAIVAGTDEAIRKRADSGKAAGTLTADLSWARHAMSLGARIVAVSVDVTLRALATRWRAPAFGLDAAAATFPHRGAE